MLTRNLVTTVVLLLLCIQADAWRRRRRRRCATHSCSWHWGPCSRACGGGVKRAIKTASQGACGSCNMPTGTQSCNAHCCRSNCQWYSWGSWGSCSRNCGGGTQTRSRGQRAASCGGTRCSGSSTQSRPCNAQCCAVHCSWGGWNSWASCSRICGSGTRSRSRSFSTAPSCGGRTCSGPRTQTVNCNTQCCPVQCSWANWGGWSSCSRNCGGGSQTRNRGYSTTAACGGRSCSGASRESRECNKQCCPQHCSWAAWSSWAHCSVSCGGGSQQRSRGYAVKAACGGTTCSGNSHDSRTCNTNCCPVNCVWDTWVSWATCSATCGGGNQARHRLVRISASCGGRRCPGNPAESRSCNTQCCPVDCVWRSWQRWGQCSESCGGGIQARSRSFAVTSSCGGQDCDGVTMDQRACNDQCCPVDCSWALWTGWEACSVSCGGGTQSRNRGEAVAKYCGGSACDGDPAQTRQCNSQCCPVQCSWAQWGDWSSCSRICGGGDQSRNRGYLTTASCNGKLCTGPARESRQCNNQCCPQHCSWATWSDWGICSVSCGGGNQNRSRAHAVNAVCGGKACMGNSHETRNCNSNCCPVNCEWDTWGSWETCSATCGRGNQVRRRPAKISASCGGRNCAGLSSESRQCNTQCCPVDCRWDSWQKWGNCSARCGGGTQRRSRVFAVSSSCGGRDCDGVALDERTCNEACCPVHCIWASWSDWGSCSVSCGSGVQSRSRGEDVAKYCGGNSCEGKSTQTRKCNSHCCPVACVWNDWSHWNSCSVSCGGGKQQRGRSIAVSSACGGAECVGTSSQVQTCNSQCCPVNCEWNNWAQWGVCSKSCEKGTQRRTRTIAVESQCNGNRCLGSTHHDRFCNDVCCPVHCRWTDWNEWTQCTKTCGNGTQTRQREVRVEPACEGEKCIGDNTESSSCNAHCCPVDCEVTLWTIWSECSHSCGAQGVRIRNRNITQPSLCGGTPCSNIMSERESCNRICFNGGKADENICQCTDGWVGECCEEDIDECDTVICPQNSKCMNILGSYDCICDHGYTKSGEICMDIDECRLELHNCHEQASCINRDGHYTCRCNPGFTGNGTFCEDFNECGNDDYYENDTETDYQYWERFANASLGPICHDDADCINTFGSYRCECIDGFSGDGEYCTDINECLTHTKKNGPSSDENAQDATLTCDQNATCQNVPGSYYCFCKEGFSGDGSSCKEIDECVSEPCQNEGKCADFLGGFKCLCSDGFHGEFCQYDIDECVTVANNIIMAAGTDQYNKSLGISRNISCSEQSTCTNTYGSFVCTCNRGYTGDGFLCSDLNECALMEISDANSSDEVLPCHVNATCTNVVGNYACECNRGYRGSGYECEEIDECESAPCIHGGTCINQLASFKCLCPLGYRGQFCESDINECNDGDHGCDPEFGRCINSNGTHSCICKDGFLGDGKICTDIDECRLGLHDCNATENNECRNTMGSYLCVCIDGYEKVDRKCYDVDECEIGNHACTGLYEECKNTNGSYRCECRAPTMKRNGTCEELYSAMMQENSQNTDTWTKVVNTLKKPRMLVIVVLTAILLIATVALVIKISSRRSRGSYAVSHNSEDTYSQRRSSIVTEDVTL